MICFRFIIYYRVLSQSEEVLISVLAHDVLYDLIKCHLHNLLTIYERDDLHVL